MRSISTPPWTGCCWGAALSFSVPIHTPGWREALWEISALSKNTMQCPWPGLEPRQLDPETSAITTGPPPPWISPFYLGYEEMSFDLTLTKSQSTSLNTAFPTVIFTTEKQSRPSQKQTAVVSGNIKLEVLVSNELWFNFNKVTKHQFEYSFSNSDPHHWKAKPPRSKQPWYQKYPVKRSTSLNFQLFMRPCGLF